MYKRILVPIDGSRASNLGLAEAVRLAKSQRATLCLLHVVDESVIGRAYDTGGAGLDRLLSALRESGRKVIARASAKLRKQRIRFKAVTVENMLGSVSDVIVRQARRQRADLIVLGTHGRRGLTRMVMGSDAEGVVRSSPVPVLLVRSPGRSR
jgi:nucleotide-binding universal stress UspA family protein